MKTIKNRSQYLQTFAIFLLCLTSIKILCQNKDPLNEDSIEIQITLDTDKVTINDTIILQVNLINKSDKPLPVYPKGILYIKHKEDPAFVFHDSPERISYYLNNNFDFDETNLLGPNDTCTLFFSVKVNNTFFYQGTNSLFVVYHQKKENGNFVFISKYFNLTVE